MRGWRLGLFGIALAALALAALLWFLPARWAVALIQPRLHGVQLQQVQGLAWRGRAGHVLSARGQPLGTLQWMLSRHALLGEVNLQLALDGPTMQFHGSLHQRAGDDQADWRDVTWKLDLAALKPPLATPFGWLQGTLEGQAPYARMQAGWPLQMDARMHWRDATLLSRSGRIALGDLQFELHGEHGMIHTQMHDEGAGPLALTGQLDLSPLGWRLDANLGPRGVDPALRRWLATLGRPDADGTVHLQRRGGLAAALPAKGAKP